MRYGSSAAAAVVLVSQSLHDRLVPALWSILLHFRIVLLHKLGVAIQLDASRSSVCIESRLKLETTACEYTFYNTGQWRLSTNDACKNCDKSIHIYTCIYMYIHA